MKENNTKMVVAGLLILELIAAVDILGVTVLVPTLRSYFNIPLDLAGWILLAYLVPFTLGMIPIGWLADKTGKPERIMVICMFGFAVFSLFCALAPNIYFLILFRILKGICAAGMFTTEFALIIKYWKEPRQTIETVVTGLGVGILIGPAVGGLFAHPAYWRYFFFFGAISATIASCFLMQISALTPVFRKADEDAHSYSEFLNKIKHLAKPLIWGSILNFTMALASQGTNLLVTLHLQETLGKSALYNSAILAVIAAGAVLVNALKLGSRLVKRVDIAAWGSAFLFALGLILLASISWIGLTAWILYFCLGILLGVTLSTIQLMTLKDLPTANLALGNGICVTFMQAGMALSALTPILYMRFNTNSVYALASILLILVIIYSFTPKKYKIKS